MLKFKIIRGFLMICTLLPICAHAAMKQGYIGAEVIQTTQNYKKGFGKNVFKKNPQDYAAFVGFKFHPHFGAELGLEYQPKRNKNASLVAGDASPGTPALTGNQSAVLKTYIKGSHPYLGIFAETGYSKNAFGHAKIQGLIAASVTHIKAQTIPLVSDGITVTPALAASGTRDYSTTKVVPMIKLSVVNSFNQHLAMRISANYRNLGSIKPMSKTTNSSAQIKLRDTLGLGIGIIYCL